jgi:hypothetical protein
MSKVDMSPAAIATRLKRVSQLRRLGLSLQKARIKPNERVVPSPKEAKPTKRQAQDSKE